jgi:hypothetical protein
MDKNIELSPIVIVQDRYQGQYSGGAWLGIANALENTNHGNRVQFVLDDSSELGPSGSDFAAMEFWADPPQWISVGLTPDHALQNLVNGIMVSAFIRK